MEMLNLYSGVWQKLLNDVEVEMASMADTNTLLMMMEGYLLKKPLKKLRMHLRVNQKNMAMKSVWSGKMLISHMQKMYCNGCEFMADQLGWINFYDVNEF